MSNKSFQPPVISGFHCVGYVKQAQGLKGEIYVQLNAEGADWLIDDVESLGLVGFGTRELRSYEIERWREHKDGLVVKLRGVDDRNQSELLRKSSVYVDEKFLVAEEGDTIFLKQIEGFSLVAVDGAVLGAIVGFSSNGEQDLLEVRGADGRVVLVPLIDEFLRDIDFDKRIVTMDLPQGLLDL